MKRIYLSVNAAVFVCASLGTAGCKSKKDKEEVKTEEPKTTLENAPTVETTVPTATDPELDRGLTDALKDHPTVKYSINDGKIVLTGAISKDRWMALKQNLDKLKSKGYDLTGLNIK